MGQFAPHSTNGTVNGTPILGLAYVGAGRQLSRGPRKDAPRFAHVGPRRGVGAKVGQLPHPRGEVAPGGTVGETTAKRGVGQVPPGADRMTRIG
jgi:hypothetical protein